MKSFFAGIMIAIAATAYLTVGGTIGAFLFSVGLIGILYFEFELFTGKAGLLASKEIGVWKILEIWIGNFFGTFCLVALMYFTQKWPALTEAATEIVQVRISNGFIENVLLSIPTGILMYLAVSSKKPIIPVMVFILTGFNHVIADMVYCHLAMIPDGYWMLVPTTIGNVIGCCVVPLLNRS